MTMNENEKKFMQELLFKQAQITLHYMEEANSRIIEKNLDDLAAARIRVDALSKSTREHAKLFSVYAIKAREYGFNNDLINQKNLQKAAYDNYQLSEYFKSRTNDEINKVLQNNPPHILTKSFILHNFSKVAGQSLTILDIGLKLIDGDTKDAVHATAGALVAGFLGARVLSSSSRVITVVAFGVFVST